MDSAPNARLLWSEVFIWTCTLTLSTLTNTVRVQGEKTNKYASWTIQRIPLITVVGYVTMKSR